MNHAPQPSTYGQTIEFHRQLYEELIKAGYSHADLINLPLSKALLARYGSIQAVDQFLGEGTYQGVKQSYGGLSPWRKTWSRVRYDQKARYLKQIDALIALSKAVETCNALGVPCSEILNKVHFIVLHPLDRHHPQN